MSDDSTKPTDDTKQKKAKVDKKQQQIDELTLDLQRTRADFENYRKRGEADRAATYQHGQAAAIKKLLPVIDTIERAIAHVPSELADNKWALGIIGLSKNLEKTLQGLDLQKIDASAGAKFNPELHEAVQFDEETEGDEEVIAEELQSGYLYNGTPLRHAMVKVTRK
ncbi:nucleotide exchange factor GrpE [Candidatus Saccharibacteria bacterium]|nr:nucleotide exchange factor GrpE [Candidatus Saccharibacteria bacterium]